MKYFVFPISLKIETAMTYISNLVLKDASFSCCERIHSIKQCIIPVFLAVLQLFEVLLEHFKWVDISKVDLPDGFEKQVVFANASEASYFANQVKPSCVISRVFFIRRVHCIWHRRLIDVVLALLMMSVPRQSLEDALSLSVPLDHSWFLLGIDCHFTLIDLGELW